MVEKGIIGQFCKLLDLLGVFFKLKWIVLCIQNLAKIALVIGTKIITLSKNYKRYILRVTMIISIHHTTRDI